MALWTNDDGLRVKFGNTEAAVTRAGELPPAGANRITEYKATLTALTTTGQVLNDGVVIPSGARIEKVEVLAETAATSGGSATLDIGFIRLDRSTAYDDDGLVAALALASIDAAGNLVTIIPEGTSAGALVGTTLANAGVLVASYNTAAFTAGEVVVRVHWNIPRPAVTNS